ncbi:NAD-dependent epimerase/dehydratase family protein [Streptomyces sp. bgisy159]|uniref:NAD-dependent epimerase/dehydratase family protein n=1 Tax=Streptomyces sp. bgisy159 TaxID=3413795 RepID=UPI003F4A0219
MPQTATRTGGTVVLTGATGFIGSAALRALLSDGTGPRVRALVRRVPEPRRHGAPGEAGAVEWVRGDVTDPETVRGLCEGASALLHLASYIGPDEDRCAAVNVTGARTVLTEAVRAGVPRVVHLSTAAVYGAGPHRGVAVGEVPAAPVSAVSRTRLEGERFAREVGAVVLRPGLVLGPGDRWVVPVMRELRTRVPAVWAGGRALLSVAAVDDVGRLLTALARGPRPVPAGTYHVSHPVPVRCGDLLSGLAERGVLPPVPDVDWPWERCVERLRATPGRASERQLAMLVRDHWYRSDDIWRLADCPPGPGFPERLAEAADWYGAGPTEPGGA